jgi:hypothetical protein
LSRRGSALAVDADGAFDIAGFGVGEVWFQVIAPGYANWMTCAFTVAGHPLELGTIALSKRQDLLVRLRSEDQLDYGSYEVEVQGDERYPAVRFDERGEANVAGVTPGWWELHVYGDDASLVVMPAYLTAGGRWIVDIPMSGDAQLDVEIQSSGGQPLPEGLGVLCTTAGALGARNDRYVSITPEGHAHFEHLPVGSIGVNVFDSNRTLACRSITLASGANSLEIDLSTEGVPVRVVDRDKRPLANADVVLRSPRENNFWRVSQRTDTGGWTSLPCAPYTDVLVALGHPECGWAVGIPIDLTHPRTEPLELVLDAPARIATEFRDDAAVLAGIQVHVADETDMLFSRMMTTSALGALDVEHVSASRFFVEVIHPGYWRARHDLVASLGGQREIVQVRRLGSLRIQARDATTGLKRAGAELALHSVEFDHDVAAWIAAGLVSSPSHGLATDATGELAIQGLPHGQYSWSAPSGAHGLVDVPPHAIGLAEIVLP